MPRIRLPSRKGIVVSASALAIALVGSLTVVAARTGSPSAIFGGADPGTNNAVQVGAAISGGSSDTHEGVTATITGVVADDTRTVVGISFRGREAEGAGVFPLGQAQLIDQDGRIYRETAGASDQNDLRLVTRTYPPLDPSTRSLTMEINGIVLLNRNSDPAQGVRLNSQWGLRFDLPTGPARSAVLSLQDARRPMGSGAIVIDDVLQAPSGTVFRGHLEGFTMDEIAELGFRASLTGPDGNPQPFIGLRAGFGTNREQFEVRFPVTSGNATLQMLATVSPQPHDLAAGQSLQQKIQGVSPADWRVTLP